MCRRSPFVSLRTMPLPHFCRRPMVSGLQRSLTSTYTTAEAATLEDFQCQICLSTLRSCVALEPCGHNFCATCLSHHFASLLQVGSRAWGLCGRCG